MDDDVIELNVRVRFFLEFNSFFCFSPETDAGQAPGDENCTVKIDGEGTGVRGRLEPMGANGLRTPHI